MSSGLRFAMLSVKLPVRLFLVARFAVERKGAIARLLAVLPGVVPDYLPAMTVPLGTGLRRP